MLRAPLCAFVLLCASGASAQPRFAAELVGSSFPTPLVLAPSTERAGYLELRNAGTETWQPGTTNLGTTQPRDVLSPIAGPDWIGGNRAATIDRAVAPGETGRFMFTVRAPAAVGTYTQTFNLVQELVAWFSDDGGPADDVLVLSVNVREEIPDVDGDGDGSLASEDCNDDDPGRHPGAPEICADGVDQDCDGIDRACNGSDGGVSRSDAGSSTPAESEGCSAARPSALGWLVVAVLFATGRRNRRC
jgi:hypothetical protein